MLNCLLALTKYSPVDAHLLMHCICGFYTNGLSACLQHNNFFRMFILQTRRRRAKSAANFIWHLLNLGL